MTCTYIVIYLYNSILSLSRLLSSGISNMTAYTPNDIKQELYTCLINFGQDIDNFKKDQKNNYRTVANHTIYSDNIGTHAHQLVWLLKYQHPLLQQMYP